MKISDVKKNLSTAEIIISLLIITGLNFLVIYLAGYKQNTLFYEVLYTARLTMFLFNIAICLFILAGSSQIIFKYWILFWTGSFIAYAVHVYYSFFLFFNGSVSQFYEDQGVFVATLNVVISVWWLLDIVLIWLTNISDKWVIIERYGIKILVFLAFFVSTVFLHAVDNKELFVIIMGYVLGVSAIICVIIRIASNKKTASS